ncbi:MAG TPA: histidine phosphatase family protein [Dyadobacter sp.]|jgi:phosphohistidine phosphatase|nr:histidine phosphatase family protein [Dyadobacter sp.]
MIKTLILVRHATAEEDNFRIKDFERQLVSKGLSEAALMGKWFRQNAIDPDRFITSTAARAYKTAEVVADQLHVDISGIVLEGSLYNGGPKAYLSAVNDTPKDTSVLVLFGHNPDITYFGEYLSGKDLGSMKKGSAVILNFQNLEWDEISAKTGVFVSYTTPKDVIKEQGENE